MYHNPDIINVPLLVTSAEKFTCLLPNLLIISLFFRLNMDLDRESLELMLNLLDTDSRIKDALDGSGMNKRELEKNKQKVSPISYGF